MKTIALIDTHQGGHHLTYLRFFTKSLLELGYRVMTFCPEPTEVSKWITRNCAKQAHLLYAFKAQEPKPIQLPIIGRLPQPLTVLIRWRYAAATIQNASSKVGNSPDLVFFTWIDNYLSHYLTHHIVDQIFPYNWSGLYVHPSHLRFKRRLLPIRRDPLSHSAILQSSRCRAVAVLNEDIVEELQDKIKSPVITFPDVADESPPDLNFPIAKQVREKAGVRKVIGLLGSLNKRKGFLTLLEVAQKAMGEDWFFVFAGPLSKHDFSHQELTRIQTIVQSNPSNCLFHFESIPDGAPFNALVNECDILFAAYENFPYSSNILTKAAVFKKPVVVSDTFCIGTRVRKFKLGLSIPEGDISKCIETLRCLCNQSELNAYPFQPDFESYHRLHSNEKLCAVFQAILDPV